LSKAWTNELGLSWITLFTPICIIISYYLIFIAMWLTVMLYEFA